MSLPVFLALLLPLLISFATMLFLGIAHSPKGANHYSVLSYFPYELFEPADSLYTRFARIMEGIYLLSDVASKSVLLYFYRDSNATGLSFLAALVISSALQDLSLLFLSVIKASYEKSHLSLFFLSASLSALSSSMAAFFLRFLIVGAGNRNGLYAVVAILLVVAACEFLLLLNPKLKKWAELDKVSEKDGTVSLARPRPFVLAFSEWLVFFLSFLSSIAALVGFLWVAA